MVFPWSLPGSERSAEDIQLQAAVEPWRWTFCHILSHFLKHSEALNKWICILQETVLLSTQRDTEPAVTPEWGCCYPWTMGSKDPRYSVGLGFIARVNRDRKSFPKRVQHPQGLLLKGTFWITWKIPSCRCNCSLKWLLLEWMSRMRGREHSLRLWNYHLDRSKFPAFIQCLPTVLPELWAQGHSQIRGFSPDCNSSVLIYE